MRSRDMDSVVVFGFMGFVFGWGRAGDGDEDGEVFERAIAVG